MLVLSVRIGEVVAIGDAAAIKVLDKSGRVVRLQIASALAPITIHADGLIPRRFTAGLSGEMRAAG